MKLSEAIRLGSLLVPEPTQGDIAACAITMACKAQGLAIADPLQQYRYYELFSKEWPWIRQMLVSCPVCRQTLAKEEVVWHPFDVHVMSRREWTIEQLADWIASIEPRESPDPTLPQPDRDEDREEVLTNAAQERQV